MVLRTLLLEQLERLPLEELQMKSTSQCWLRAKVFRGVKDLVGKLREWRNEE